MTGSKILTFYKEKISKEQKIAFYSAVIIGFIIHFYKFSNTLLNHDSVFNYYSSQNMVGSGRWLLSIACGISSFFDLPWVIGVLSLLFIALTSVVIADLFKLKNPVVIAITSGLLVSFPAITETLFFGFTADGYFLAMLLAAIAARLQTIEDNKKSHLFISSALICMACGIYQAYVSFAAVLMICYFIYYLLTEECEIKTALIWIGKQAVNFVIALASYFVIWKICLKLEHVTANSYQGIDSVGFSVSTIISAMPKLIKSFAMFFLEWNVLEHGWSLFAVLNVLFILLAGVTVLFIAVKSGILKQKIKTLLIIVAACGIPLAAYMWLFTSPDVDYSYRMLASLFMLFAFVMILADRFYNKYLSSALAVLLVVMIFNNGINANVAYFHLDREYKTAYATGSEVMSRIHENDLNTDKLLVIGDTAVDAAFAPDSAFAKLTPTYAAGIEKTYLFNYEHYVYFLNNTFNTDYSPVSEEDLTAIYESGETEKMGVWPAGNSVREIEGVIVIKLSDNNQ